MREANKSASQAGQPSGIFWEGVAKGVEAFWYPEDIE